MRTGNGMSEARQLIEWGVAVQALFEGDESGDQYLVETFPEGVLVAVVDGLGHGPDAVAAARTAIAVLRGHAHAPVADLLKCCHTKLAKTRGAVMSLASFNAVAMTMTWVGVGNVRGLLLRADERATRPCESLLQRGGVVGYQMPSLYPAAIPVAPGDTLILATDGLRGDLLGGLALVDSPQEIADHILARGGKETDDALVLVARYLGREVAATAEIEAGVD